MGATNLLGDQKYSNPSDMAPKRIQQVNINHNLQIVPTRSLTIDLRKLFLCDSENVEAGILIGEDVLQALA